MANLWIDGAGGVSTATAGRKVDASSALEVLPLGNRTGDGPAYNLASGSGFYRKALPGTYATLYVGFSVQPSGMYATASGNIIAALYDGGTLQCGVAAFPDGSVQFFRSGTATLIGTRSAAGLVTSAAAYYEFSATIADAAGACEFRVNGATIHTASAVDTKATANAYATQFQIAGGIPANSPITDIYCNDASGGAPDNTFWGDTRVDPLNPTGNGATVQFTPSAGANYQNVDDGTSPDDDATYNESATVGHVDEFDVSNLPSLTGTIRGVQAWGLFKKTDAAARSMRVGIKAGGTRYGGTAFTLSSGYAGPPIASTPRWAVHPGTAATWTATEVDALQVYYEVVS